MARNKELAKSHRGKPCIVCGDPGEGDHIKNYAGNPDNDVPVNVWTLCRFHHIEKGWSLNDFVVNYKLEGELQSRGFEFSDLSNKWIRPLK